MNESVLVDAIDRLRAALFLFDADGRETLRNAAAAQLAQDRHAGVLAIAALKELVQSAVHAPTERTLDLYGPPTRRFILRAEPLAERAMLGIIEDTTEVSHLESVRRDFVANVSHELRTPIGAVLVLAEALAEETDPAVVRRLTERMVAEADRAARVVSDLLELSRLEAGPFEPFRPVQVASVVATASQAVSAAAEQAGVRLSVPEVDAGLVVQGDEAQLCSAVSNLLDNAVKYSDRGGAVELSVESEGQDVVITVRDHGPGIPSKDLDRVFERFYRVDRARSRDTGGTGLGLAIVRHVAGNHGGSVDVESVEGEGACFRLRLPKAAQ